MKWQCHCSYLRGQLEFANDTIKRLDKLAVKKNDRITELEQQLADTVQLMQKARDEVVPLRLEVERWKERYERWKSTAEVKIQKVEQLEAEQALGKE